MRIQLSGGDQDLIDRAAPLLGLLGLLLGLATLVPYLEPGFSLAGFAALLGACLSIVALVKRQFVLGGLAFAVCSLVIGLSMWHPLTPPQMVYLSPAAHTNGLLPHGPDVRSKPPASL